MMKPTRFQLWQSAWLTFAALVCGGALGLASNVRAAAEFSWQTNATSVALVAGEKTVWQFNYGTNGTKPFFHPLALPGGSPLTWQNPPDHVWHYGLWFSWKFLNGTNYWEENKQRVCDGTTSWRVEKIETRADHSAQIQLALDYRPRGATTAVLTEQRTITIAAPAADGSYALDWTLRFQAGAEPVKFDRTPLLGEPGGKTYGGYAGLSLRFAKELTEPQVAATAAIGEPTDNRFRFAATAADFSGSLDGAEVGVAILDHPANLRHPVRWYANVNAKSSFNFLNSAWIQLQPFELAANETFTLRYRVLVHPQRWPAARLDAEQKKFAATASARAVKSVVK